ncbi:flagellar hook-associated protein FlgK [Frateuria defendens]|uniref:flagellar hook-associated protein FlgK n=1 Tax=Frateuria defendens TaxID=2219559 RepID=UPI00066FF0E3|nr:flagellar hook-associated protein FlgK [Frateuria defendens]
MSNMLSIGVSGLGAAQTALNTVSNNIANAGTDGYSRQSVAQVERIAQSNGRYTVGSGVDVVSVQRAYSQYLSQAVWSGNSALQGATAANDLAGALNGLLANGGDLQGALDTFYGAFATVANTPNDSSARTALLGKASSLTAVFNTLGSQLAQQQGQVNSQIGSTVDSINTTAKQIAALNDRIRQAGTGGPPNDLLDQRDQLIKQLAGYTGIATSAQGDGTVSVFASSGQPLVSGSNAYGLTLGSDPYDATRNVVVDATGNDIGGQLGGGTLGALLNYRSQVLDPVQNRLGQAATALAASVNAQQAKGLDLDGAQGGALFATPGPAVLASKNNSAAAPVVSASVTDASRLTTSDYVLKYTGNTTAPSANGWTLSTTAGQGVALTANADGTLSADGLSFAVAGTAQVGDSYQIQPTRQAAVGLAVATTSPSKIAAAAALAASAGSGNAGSGKVAAVAVQDAADAKLFNGATVSFTSASAYTVTDSAGNSISGTYTAGQPIRFNGWSLTLSGAPAAGDSFAVGKNKGLNDNSNALSLAALADTGMLDGGKTSVMGAYASLTSTIGSVGSQAAAELDTRTSLYNQAVSAQQSGAGVNLDEEAANLVKFQQAYQASAQVIATAQTLFSSLIGALQA